MSYDPSSTNGVIYGGYSTVTQAANTHTVGTSTVDYQINFDTAVGACSVSSDCVIPNHPRSLAFCDIATQGTSSVLNIFRYGFSEALNDQNAGNNRSQQSNSDEMAFGLVLDSARVNVSLVFRSAGTWNYDLKSQLAGIFI